MLLELGKPLSLLICVLALYSVFSVAFLMPDTATGPRLWLTGELVVLWGAISVVSGQLFREPEEPSKDEMERQWRAWREHWRTLEGWPETAMETPTLLETLPMQVFVWGTVVMAALFVASWSLESYCVLYRDVHRF
jgi:hypothetical protein